MVKMLLHPSHVAAAVKRRPGFGQGRGKAACDKVLMKTFSIIRYQSDLNKVLMKTFSRITYQSARNEILMKTFVVFHTYQFA